MSKMHFIKGTLLLSSAGLLTRLIGFFYRIFLSKTIGAEGLGIYQLIIPLQTLILSISVTGVQMAISRLCAGRFALKKDQEGCDYFALGTIISFLLTCLLAIHLYFFSDFWAVQILKESRTKDLIRILSFSLPLSAVHTCISSYYFARKDTRVPSFLQLMEQIVRTAITYLLFLIFVSEHREITAMIAIVGSLAGELSSALFGSLFLGIYLHSNHLRFFHLQNVKDHAKNLLSMALPLSLNRILLTLLGSIEVVLIPQQLSKYGLSSKEALSVYGIFTGMALPLIMFPGTITTSVSVMLMPSIAELQALGCFQRIKSVSKLACKLTFAMGFACCLIFLFCGNLFGNQLFHNASAGDYIRSMAFLCPFLYLHTTMASILHGLGQTTVCLFHNLAGACIRLFFVVCTIPVLGIRGYLYGLLVSELALVLMHLFRMQSIINEQ